MAGRKPGFAPLETISRERVGSDYSSQYEVNEFQGKTWACLQAASEDSSILTAPDSWAMGREGLVWLPWSVSSGAPGEVRGSKCTCGTSQGGKITPLLRTRGLCPPPSRLSSFHLQGGRERLRWWP